MGPQNADQKIRRRAGPIFLSIAYLSMKMTWGIHASSCDPRWVHYFDSEAKKAEYAMKVLLLTPLLRSLREFLLLGMWWPLSFGIVSVLSWGWSINCVYYAEELKRLRQDIVKKRRGKLALGVLLFQDNVPAHTSEVILAEQRLNAASRY